MRSSLTTYGGEKSTLEWNTKQQWQQQQQQKKSAYILAPAPAPTSVYS